MNRHTNRRNLSFGFGAPERRSGFTLMEMLVVLAILLTAILLAFYATGFSVSQRDRLVAETDRLVGTVNATRTKSLTDGGPWNRLVFYMDEQDGQRYWVDQVVPKNPAAPEDIDLSTSNSEVFVPMAIPVHKLDTAVQIESVYINNTDVASTYTLKNNFGVAVRFSQEGTADEAMITLVSTGTETLRSQVRIIPGTAKPVVEALPE